MFYWPQPSELRFVLSRQAAEKACAIIPANILSVDRCWRGSDPDGYIRPVTTYHLETIDQEARDYLLDNADRIEMPEVMMLGNSHIAMLAGSHLFVLIREMAELGYIEQIPFAVLPWDADKFSYYFKTKRETGWENVPRKDCPFSEQPMLQKYGVA